MAEDYNLIKCDSKEMQALVDAAYNVGYTQGLENGKKERPSLIYAKYEQGLNDAWKYARKLCETDTNNKDGYCLATTLFHDLIGEVLHKYTAAEAITKIKEYEEKCKNEIQIGDEVITNVCKRKGIVIQIATIISDNIKYEYTIWTGATIYYANEHNTIQKTGRHFKEIPELIQAMESKET